MRRQEIRNNGQRPYLKAACPAEGRAENLPNNSAQIAQYAFARLPPAAFKASRNRTPRARREIAAVPEFYH